MPGDEPTAAEPNVAKAPTPVDLGRRRFFRAFAGELINTAATVAGAAQALQQASAEAASVILNPEGAARLLGPPGDDASGTPGAAVGGAGPSGFRTPFREDAGTLYLIDQRRLPDALVEYPCRSAGEVAFAIREMIVRGAPAIGQVAAIGLAMSAESQADGRPYARKATLRGGANALINARPTAVNLRWAVERVLARYTELDELSEDGFAIARAMREEADAIVFEATTDHGRLAGFGLEILPTPDDRPVRILTHCNTGPLACGQYGTALGIVQAAHHADRPVHVWVDETRPYLQGARLTTWELAQAGVPHALDPRRGRRTPDVARRGRRRAGRGGSRGRQRRHRQQGRHLPAGRARGASRHPVLRRARRRPRSTSRRPTAPRSSSRSAAPTRSSSSAASASRRPAPTCATPPSTSRRPSSSPGSSPRRASCAVRSSPALRDATERARERWASMPGFRAIRPAPAEEPAPAAESASAAEPPPADQPATASVGD